MREDPGDGGVGDLREAVLARRVVEQRPPVVVHCGEVQVEARAAFVVERLGHERGQLALAAGQLLDGGLEPEGPVRGVEGLGVPEVDLELAAAELVVGRHHVQPVVPQRAQRPQQEVFGVALAAGDVDVAGGLAVPAPAACAVRFEHVELQLGADHRAHAELGEPGQDLLEHLARALRRRRPIGVEDVGEAVRDAGLPRHVGEGGQVGEGDDVGQAVGEAAFAELDDVAHRAGAVDRAAERDAVAECPGEVRDQHVAAALGADEVGVAQPDDVDAAPAQFGRGGREGVLVEVTHDTS